SSIPPENKIPENLKNTERPNILWITCEDISPYLGIYGCEEALTPNLDRLAEKGIRYTHAYANAPVCAVARSTILSGMYASTTGTHQMRSRPQLPEEIPAYPKIFRQAGYYTSNNSKKDYNSNYENDHSLWDDSGIAAHYRNRKEDQPFFSVFNILVTHESQLQEERIQQFIEAGQIPENPRVHPADIKLPPYHPDLPEIREDWARLHDLITLMDKRVGDLLQELEDEGLAENTIVFFYSDHGGQLARSKRYIYNVGTQVPFIVYLPERWQHLSKKHPGDKDSRLISFVDLAPTVLSIAGLKVPEKMQGTVFLGPETIQAPEYVHFYRDRMAERYDFSRAVSNGRDYFIRNFFPHRPPGRDSRYGYQVQANWRAWEEAYDRGECNEIQSQFYQPRSTFELFDTKKDPWHITNLASQKKQEKIVKELSEELDQWMIETRDAGLIPEPMFHDLAGEGRKFATIYEYAQSGDYPVEEILEAAKEAGTGDQANRSAYLGYLDDNHPVIRFWGAYGLFLIRPGDVDVQDALREVIKKDGFAANRIMAAQALGLCGDPDMAFQSIMKEINDAEQGYILLQGINALQYSHTDDRLSLDDWKRFQKIEFPEEDYGASYPQRIISDAIELFPDRRIVD
ncbi:MAG: sulfatase, partial [Bacteroidales bacterium]|nr:sulfatase [Bacteroidales bacterium]